MNKALMSVSTSLWLFSEYGFAQVANYLRRGYGLKEEPTNAWRNRAVM